MTRPARAALAVPAFIALAFSAGCNRVQNMLAPVGDQAMEIGRVWNLMLWICVPVYVLVLLAVGVAVCRKQWRKEGRKQERNHGRIASDRTLVGGLWAWSIAIAVLLTAMTAASYAVDRRLHAPAPDALQVRITAKQWWWQVDYIDPANPARNLTTANELHLPAGRPAQIELQSTDVIHSLWIPVLAGKEDLIPGYTNTITITPRVPGDYRGQCAEFCGLQHAHMALDVRIDEPAAFESWWTAQLAPALAASDGDSARGRQLFEQGPCALCHRIRGTSAGGTSGPDLTHIASRRTLAAGTLPLDRDTLAAWIRDPQHYKPGVHMPPAPLPAADVHAIAAYLMELQ
ncbi:MAG: cytochrome c oxidase subunit II [Gammaproteobacteria bacterium]